MIEDLEYYRNLHGVLSRTVYEEERDLVEELSLDPAWVYADNEQKSDMLKKAYIGSEVAQQYAHIKSMRTPDVYPRHKPDTGKKLCQVFDPTAGMIKFRDEFSAPFSFESKSMQDLRFDEDGKLWDPEDLDETDLRKSVTEKYKVQQDNPDIEQAFGVTLKKAKDRQKTTNADFVPATLQKRKAPKPQQQAAATASNTIDRHRQLSNAPSDAGSTNSMRRRAPPVPMQRASKNHAVSNQGHNQKHHTPKQKTPTRKAPTVKSTLPPESKSGFEFLDN